MNKYTKAISITIAFILAITILLNYDISSSFANETTNLLEIDADPNESNSSPMFSQGLWAPGVKQNGIMRINNNTTQNSRINSLRLTMTLEDSEGRIIRPNNSDRLYENYAKNMKLTIKKGNLLGSPIYKGSFYEMLYEDDVDSFDGFKLPILKQFKINKEDHLNLLYTVKMDEKAGNELQGLKSTVTFMVNINEDI